MQQKHPVRLNAWKLKTISLVVGAILYSGSLYAQNESIEFNLPVQSLQSSVEHIAQQGNVHILYVSTILQNKKAPALSGQYTIDQALQQLLQGTSLTVQKNGNAWSIVEGEMLSTTIQQQAIQQTAQETVQLAPMTVYGEKDRDTQGYDDVYDKNYSTVYAGKDLIERYKGTTPSDLFKGMANVYSGDARNSGALDPNIRGIQGEGRIPLTIDGTEQALTVWRGYNGANNRNYIDPNLISSIQVVKGSGIDRDVKTGIGGGIAVKTLEVDDVVRAGEKYGAEIKIEGATNTTKERVPSSSYVGRDYRDVVEEQGLAWSPSVYSDPLSGVVAEDKGKDLDHFQDKALRIAIATKQDNFDLLAAYAYRDRGNYYAGNKGSDFFVYDEKSANNFNFVPYMATVFSPNKEVSNTSNRMESYLLKGTWKPTDDQFLQLTYRDSNTIYGEILPSRIAWWDYGNGTVPQWQLSEITTKAYSLDYRYNPVGNRWIDLKASLWQTDTDSNTHTAGGFPHFVKDRDTRFDYGFGRSPDSATVGKDFTIRNTTLARAENTRKGVSLSNKFNLLDNLNLTLGADLTREKLVNSDEYYNDATISRAAGYRMLPRAGRRSENQYHFNVDWQPTSWLSLTAGAKSVSYWSFDDFLNESEQFRNSSKLDHIKLNYTVNVDNYTQEMLEKEKAGLQELYEFKLNHATTGGGDDRTLLSQIDTLEEKLGQAAKVTYYVNWYPDQYGKYHRENNPLLNGEINLNTLNLTDSLRENNYFSAYVAAGNTVEKQKDHQNWAPSLSATFHINSNNRLYVNYSETYRMPSLFETTIGFSASRSGYPVKPEHAHNFEIAYIYNMKDLFSLNTGNADVKLAYFRNKTDDVIERDSGLRFTNIDKQTIAGWELQSRYDNGIIFGDLSFVYNQKNKVCDQSSALMTSLETMRYGVDNYCTDYGFHNGYLINMALPKYQANLTLGTRLFDNKFELGTRTTYFHKFISPLESVSDLGFLNAPLRWDNTYLLDAYAHYQHNQHVGFDLVGTNLTNQYYLDPLSRSAMPAPGRTYKVALTYKF